MNVRFGKNSAPPNGDVFELEGKGWEMRQLAKDWVKPGVTREEREEMTRKLFREALGQLDRFQPWFFSFCNGYWQQDCNTTHCVQR